MLPTSSAKTNKVPSQQKIHDNLHDAVRVLDIPLVKQWIWEGASPRHCESFRCKFSVISEAFNFPYTNCNQKKQIEILEHILEKESSNQEVDGYKIVNQCIVSGNYQIFVRLRSQIEKNIKNMKRYDVVLMIKNLAHLLEKNNGLEQEKSTQDIQKCFDRILWHLYNRLRPHCCFSLDATIEIEKSLEPLASTVWRPFILSRIAYEEDLKFRRAVVDRDIKTIAMWVFMNIDVNKYFPFNRLDPHRALFLAVFPYNHSAIDQSRKLEKQYMTAQILLEAGAKSDDYRYILKAMDSNNLPLIRLLFDYKAPISFSEVIRSILYDFWEKDDSKNACEIYYGKEWGSLSISEITSNLSAIFDAKQYTPKQIKGLEGVAMVLVLMARKSYEELIIFFDKVSQTPEKWNFFDKLLFETAHKEINRINQRSELDAEQTKRINKIIFDNFRCDKKASNLLCIINHGNILLYLHTSLKKNLQLIITRCFEFIDQSYGCKIARFEEGYKIQIDKTFLSLQEEKINLLIDSISLLFLLKKDLLFVEFAEDFFDPTFSYKPEKLKLRDTHLLLLKALFFHIANPLKSLDILKLFVYVMCEEERLLKLILQIPSVVAMLDEKACLDLLFFLQPSKIHAVIKALPLERVEQILEEKKYSDLIEQKDMSSRGQCDLFNTYFNSVVLTPSTLWHFTETCSENSDGYESFNRSSLIEDKNSFMNISLNINTISFLEMALIFNAFHAPFPYSAQNTLKFLQFFNTRQLAVTIPLFSNEFFLSVVRLEENFPKKIRYLQCTREEQRLHLLEHNVLLPDCYHHLKKMKISFMDTIRKIEGKDSGNERDEEVLSLRKNFEQESYKLMDSNFIENELQQLFQALCFGECSQELALKIEEKKKEYTSFFENISKEIAILRSKIDSL